MRASNAGNGDWQISSLFILVFVLAAISLTALAVLFGLDYIGLIDLSEINGYPYYRLR